MKWFRVVVARLRGLLWPEAISQDIEEELRFHVEMETQSNIERGMAPEEAHRSALRNFGNMGRIKDMAHEVRGGGFVETLWQDLRYGLRMMVKSKSTTSVAVLSLALGVGANTAIFSVVNAVLLRPLPYKDSDRLVLLWTDNPRQDIHEEGTSYPNFEDWKSLNSTFEDMAICSRGNPATLTGSADPERVQGERVSANFFSLFGVPPVLGRTFSPEEEERGERVVVVSHALWQRRLGGSPEVIGKTLEIDGRNSQVVGVMPASFQFPSKDTPLWEPVTLYGNWANVKAQRYTDWWRVIGRLKPTVTVAQAQADMNAISRRLAQAYPTTDADFAGFGINVVPLSIQITGHRVRLALWVLLGAVVLVLLIACANVANLLLARGAAREREFAIRLALGVSRARLLRQLFTESVLLALIGGALGLLLAHWGVGALIALGQGNIPRLEEVSLNTPVLAFTVGVSLIAGVLFGLAPALKMSRSNPHQSLKEGGRGASSGPGGGRTRRVLVVTEFALAVVLLCGAGLLIHSFLRLQAVDSGLRPERVLVVKVAVSESKSRAQKLAFYQEALDRLAALPGVQAAGASSHVFQEAGHNSDLVITIEGHPLAPGQNHEQLTSDVVSNNYFQTMGVRLLRGRSFSDQDGPDAARVAIINETMALRFWPGEDPVGKRFKFGDRQSLSPWRSVVGVVGDVRSGGLEKQPVAQVFLALAQNPDRGMSLVVRTASDPLQLAAAVRREVHALDRTLPLFGITTVERQLEEMGAQRRFQTLLLILFAGVALVLANVGIYGVMAYLVAQRQQEIGIRMALGARRRDVLKLVLGQGMKLSLMGIAVGLIAAVAATRVLSSLLYGVSATDPATFVGISLLLTVVALLACYFPARRATKVDPLIALRHE